LDFLELCTLDFVQVNLDNSQNNVGSTAVVTGRNIHREQVMQALKWPRGLNQSEMSKLQQLVRYGTLPSDDKEAGHVTLLS